MTRYFNEQPIELLAPVGTFEILKAVIETKCDAIYFGGRILNMRLIRKGYNLSDEEVIEGIKLAHEHGKQAYITINNLNSQFDIEEAKEYLQFLNDLAKPDAIIVQDMAIVKMVHDMKLNLSLHASVMMNVHNLETIRSLQKQGVKRVVISRDFSLSDVRFFKDQLPEMEYEYFTHGDMCVAHGSQCYFSGFLFGMSSNRGRCLKPCRWWFKVKKDGLVYDTEYPLAVKDMGMYPYLPEMIQAGVTSFKIEGRMREKEFIVDLVNQYGEALDRYIEDPLHFNRNKNYEHIVEHRKRDLSTGYAFGKPGLTNINTRYEGTGKFFSSGKMFSKPTEEKEITEEKINDLKIEIQKRESKPSDLKIAVKVNNIEQALLCLEKKIDIVYLSGNVYQPDLPWSIEEIEQLNRLKGKTLLVLGTPKIMDELDFSRYTQLLKRKKINIDGIQVSNLGALTYFKSLGYPIYGDYSLNIYNDVALEYYAQQGLHQATLSVELPLHDLMGTIEKATIPIEIIIHGLLDVMHLEHDLYENTNTFPVLKEEDNRYVDNHILVLQNEAGEYPVFKDDRDRNHLHSTKELNLSSIMVDLHQIGCNTFRIEGQIYSIEQLSIIIDAYKMKAFEKLNPNFYGFTLGALEHEVK